MEDASDSQESCPFCEQTFGSDAIKEHMGREHLNLTLETTDDGQSIWTQNKVKIEPKELKFSCPVCKVEFISQQSYKLHMKSIHNLKSKKIHTCELCKKSYNERTNYNRHLKTKHLKIRFSCDQCHQKFTTKQMLDFHIRSKHDKITYDCELCDKPLKSKRSLEEHIKSLHELKKDIKCDNCPMKFSRQSNLYQHYQAVHSSIKALYKCELCDKVYSTNSHLKRHQESVHKSITYQCKQCDKHLASKDNLRTHIKTVHQYSNVTNAPKSILIRIT